MKKTICDANHCVSDGEPSANWLIQLRSIDASASTRNAIEKVIAMDIGS